jgi:hypothetical protein
VEVPVPVSVDERQRLEEALLLEFPNYDALAAAVRTLLGRRLKEIAAGGPPQAVGF